MTRNHYNDEKWIGKRYGLLTVIKPVLHYSCRGIPRWNWLVRCDCGTEKIMLPNNILSGKVKTCGNPNCREQIRPRTKSKNERLYNIWAGMNARCFNEKVMSYRWYGARGITVCDEWKSDFISFMNWAMENGYQDNLSIERIDVNGNYCPENCKWIPLPDQAKNKRKIERLLVNGRKMNIKDACKEVGVSRQALYQRADKNGISLQEAIDKPFANGDNTLSAKCRKNNLNYFTVRGRLKNGWSLDEALTKPVRKKRRNHENTISSNFENF